MVHGRRHQVAEEVPGLYIRRLTLEDPRSAREPSAGSRSPSPSPARHICHPPRAYVHSVRGSSSYRSWLETLRKERQAVLTIVSLELPESPIPLVESQARSYRSDSSNYSVNGRDEILDELLEKVTEAGKGRERESQGESRRARRSRKKSDVSFECTKEAATLEECTRNIIEGPDRGGSLITSGKEDPTCICSAIPKNLRINICKRSEVATSMSRSPSPEVSHTIRIAMKYRSQQRCKLACNEQNDKLDNEEERKRKKTEERCRKEVRTASGNPTVAKRELIREDACCPGVNVALDFTLNCSSVRLTARDGSSRPETRGETQQEEGPEE